jgi:hypothetical protein
MLSVFGRLTSRYRTGARDHAFHSVKESDTSWRPVDGNAIKITKMIIVSSFGSATEAVFAQSSVSICDVRLVNVGCSTVVNLT